jgi:hypothetical protein
MAAIEEVTYAKLFNRFPAWFVEYLASLVNQSPEIIRKALFEIFVAEHLFICSACGGEFAARDIDETALVHCSECRR